MIEAIIDDAGQLSGKVAQPSRRAAAPKKPAHMRMAT
jgi:hypothetical protein